MHTIFSLPMQPVFFLFCQVIVNFLFFTSSLLVFFATTFSLPIDLFFFWLLQGSCMFFFRNIWCNQCQPYFSLQLSFQIISLTILIRILGGKMTIFLILYILISAPHCTTQILWFALSLSIYHIHIYCCFFLYLNHVKHIPSCTNLLFFRTDLFLWICRLQQTYKQPITTN